MEETLRSPLAESARAITDDSYEKYFRPYLPDEVVTEKELEEWRQFAFGYLESRAVVFSAVDVARLIVTVRALQRELREARAKLIEVQQVLDKQSERFWDQAANALRQEEGR